jgi:hypothetical protein
VIVAAILLGICQIITMLGATLLLRHFLNAKQAEIEARLEETVREWTAAQPDDQPSKLAVMLDATGSVIGSAAARSLMASLKQVQSSNAQVANGLSDQLQAEANPILGLLTSGKRGKGAAMMRLASLLGPLLTGKGGTTGNHGSGSGQGQFKL